MYPGHSTEVAQHHLRSLRFFRIAKTRFAQTVGNYERKLDLSDGAWALRAFTTTSFLLLATLLSKERNELT